MPLTLKPNKSLPLPAKPNESPYKNILLLNQKTNEEREKLNLSRVQQKIAATPLPVKPMAIRGITDTATAPQRISITTGDMVNPTYYTADWGKRLEQDAAAKEETARTSQPTVFNNSPLYAGQRSKADTAEAQAKAASDQYKQWQTDYDSYAKQQNINKYEAVSNNPDYQQTIRTVDGKNIETPLISIGTGNIQDKVKYAIDKEYHDKVIQSGTLRGGTQWTYLEYITDQERNTLKYYVGKNDWDSAKAYVDAITPVLNERMANKDTETISKISKDVPLFGTAVNIISSFASPIGYLANAVGAITGNKVDPNSQLFRGNRTQDASQAGVTQAAYDAVYKATGSKGWADVAKFAANLGLSIGQYASKIPLGPTGALAFMGASAAGQTSYNTLQNGGTAWQALGLGTINGVVEMLTEKIPLDNLFKLGKAEMKLTIKNVLKQAGMETAEEIVSEIANNMSDMVVMGDKSQFSKYVELLMSQKGMSYGEASAQAFMQFYVKNVGLAGLGGALSGFAMGGSAALSSNLSLNAQARNNLKTANQLTPALPTLQQNTNTVNPVTAQLPTLQQQAQAKLTPTKPQFAQVDIPQSNVQSTASAEPTPPTETAPNTLPEGMGAMSNPYPYQQKVSEFYTNTLKNTNSISDDAKAKLNERDYVFDSIGEEQSVNTARQRLEVDFQGEVEDLSKATAYTAAEDVDTAMGILSAYSQQGQEIGDYSQMAQWSRDMYEKIHQSAVTLQAVDKYSRTPEGAVIKAQQTVSEAGRKKTEKNELGKKVKTSFGRKVSTEIDNVTKIVESMVNKTPTIITAKNLEKVTLKDIRAMVETGKYSKTDIENLVKEKFNLPYLTSEDVQKIYEYMDKSLNSTDDYTKRMYESMAAQVIADRIPSSIGDKIRTVRRISMLLNPKTVISRNAGGNLVFAAAENIKDLAGTIIDRRVAKTTGQRTTSFRPFTGIQAQAKGMAKGATELIKDVKFGVNTSPTSHEMSTSTTLKSKVGSGFEKALNALLQAGDRPFYEAAYSQHINELNKLGYDTTQPEYIDEAREYALERVFQNNSKLAQKASQMRESFGVFGDITMPFVQTPANILDKVLDYTPAGYVRAIKKWGTVSDSRWSQKQFVDTLARSFTGTGIMLLGYALARAGIMFGRLPEGKKEADALRLQGVQPYSIKFGDYTYTFDWATPIGAILAVGADIAGSTKNNEGILKTLTAAAEAGLDVVFQQSYLEGLSQLFAYNNITKGLEQVVAGLPASFVPTAFGQLARVIDDTQRETYGRNIGESFLNKALAKMPWLSKMLPPKITTYGGNLPNFNARPTGLNVLESFLSPGYVNQSMATAVDSEMIKLFSATGDTDVLPPNKPDKSFVSDSVTYTMTPVEYAQFQQIRNKQIYTDVNNLMQTDVYKKADNDTKTILISKITYNARAKAKQAIIDGRK